MVSISLLVISPTSFTAVLDLLPVALPLLAPCKGPLAGDADLGREICLLDGLLLVIFHTMI